MAAGTRVDGASGKGNDETDVSKGGERNQRRFGSTSRCIAAAQEGKQARRVVAASRLWCSASIQRKEKGASGPVGPNGRMGWLGRKDGLGFKRVWAETDLGRLKNRKAFGISFQQF
jgi:hypothetical protein